MGHAHPSTADERIQWAIMMLAHQGEYGLVTKLSREAQVSRRTLYLWRVQAAAALGQAFTPTLPPVSQPAGPRQLLTLWMHHASARGIQAAMRECTQCGVSLATITAVLHEAGGRARVWMQTHVPTTVRALALDEIYANDRRGAYLNVVDVHSGAVWASEGPLAVDTESWTLVLWELQARGLHWDRVVLDGGAAMLAACTEVTPTVILQGDTWHELSSCGKVQARLQRVVTQLEQRTPAVTRQAARVAAGQAPKGRKPKTDLVAHTQEIAAARPIHARRRHWRHRRRSISYENRRSDAGRRCRGRTARSRNE
ncbi:MAG: hypothetical protein EOM24_13440 [Chloroflexia bacterium]|nr:hypothetical protein [Chloroflexia bacterium]